IWIYYPPSYDEQLRERFPVVYMHDGQNLFDPSYSFGGVTWQVQNAMDQGTADGSVREAIVIGIGNTGARIREYTPTEGGYGGGAGAQDGEPGDEWQNTAVLAQAYSDVGWIAVDHVIGHGDSHDESAWARRLPGALHFLLGPRGALH